MKVIPAMSLKHGRVTIVKDGMYQYLRNDQGQHRSPVRMVRGLPGDELFILDIDGMERCSPNLKTIKKMAAHKDIWLDAGTQDAHDMMDLFVSDASMVVMGTKALGSLEKLEEGAELSDRVIFSLDYDNGILSPSEKISNMGLEELLAKIRGLPIETAIFMDLGSSRDCTPVDLEPVRAMASVFNELYVSAHVIPEDYDALEQAGAKGIILDFRTMKGANDE